MIKSNTQPAHTALLHQRQVCVVQPSVLSVTDDRICLFTSQSMLSAPHYSPGSLQLPSPPPINHRQGRSNVRQPYLQPRKQLEVNNEAWLLQFMGRSKIATMIKISVRWKTMVQPFISTLPWNIYSHSSSLSFLHDLICRPLPWLTGLLRLTVLLKSGGAFYKLLACPLWKCVCLTVHCLHSKSAWYFYRPDTFVVSFWFTI